MTQFEKDLILEAIKTIGFGGLAYVFRVILKIVQNVSAIPKLRLDIDTAYVKIRALENKLSVNNDNPQKSSNNP